MILLLCATPIFADDTVNLDAGQLRGSSLSAMVSDNSSGSAKGSLLLLVDLGSSGKLSGSLTAGSYLSGTDSILAAGGFNNTGGTNETLTTFDISNPVLSSVNSGDDIGLLWFPQITLAQYNSGTVPTAGSVFGMYNPGGGNPDGGNAWILPAAGSLISLNFFTANSDGGGTQLASEGLASNVVVGAVPEPSTYVLMLLGLSFIVWAQRRLRIVSKS